MLKLAIRNTLRQGRRTALLVLAIAVGVATLIVVGGFVEDVLLQVREGTIRSQIGHLQATRAGYVELGRREPLGYLIDDSGALQNRLSGVPGVTSVARRLQVTALASNGRTDRPVLAEGVEPDREARIGTFVTYLEGRPLSDSDSYGAVLGRGLATALDLAPGEPVTLLATTADGAVNTLDAEVVGVFRSFFREYDDRAIRLPLAAAQELLGTSGVHTLVLSLHDTDQTDRVVAVTRDLLGHGYEVRPWYELADFYRKAVDLYRRQFAFLQLVILAMVLLSVANGINLTLNERMGEFGTLRALGNRPREVFRLVVAESALLGAVGASAGVALGIVISVGVSAMGIVMPPIPGSDSQYVGAIHVVPINVAVAFSVGIVASVLAGLRPGWRVSRMPIVEALGRNV